MNLRAVAAALALFGASGLPPDHVTPVKVAEVSKNAFTSQSRYLVDAARIDDGTTAVQQLFDHDPTEAPDVTGEVQHFRVAGVDYYVVAMA